MIEISKITVKAKANFISNGGFISKGSIFEVEPLFLVGRRHLVDEVTPKSAQEPAEHSEISLPAPTNTQSSSGPTNIKNEDSREDEYPCPDCEKVFTSKRALVGHSRVHKADREEED